MLGTSYDTFQMTQARDGRCRKTPTILLFYKIMDLSLYLKSPNYVLVTFLILRKTK